MYKILALNYQQFHKWSYHKFVIVFHQYKYHKFCRYNYLEVQYHPEIENLDNV